MRREEGQNNTVVRRQSTGQWWVLNCRLVLLRLGHNVASRQVGIIYGLPRVGKVALKTFYFLCLSSAASPPSCKQFV